MYARPMLEVLPTIERWIDDGAAVAVAILVATERSAPREPGAALAVSDRGEVAGTITSGCVEPALVEEAREVLAGCAPRLVTYGIEDEDAFAVGLPCGGSVTVFVCAIGADVASELGDAVRERRPVTAVVATEGSEAGITAADARAHPDKPTLEAGTFTLPLLPPPDLYVVGAVEHAAALSVVGRLLGYRVTVVDPRPRFATRERIPGADELVVDWPDRALASAAVDARTAVCVLSHDGKVDVPALRTALERGVGYVGAMGSRRTRERRAEALRALGVPDEAIVRIRSPIGLPLGSKTPGEVAVAAELVAFRRGRLAAADPAELVSR